MSVDLDLGHTRAIIADLKAMGMLRSQMAYVLATAYWETAHTMEPVREAFWLSEDWRRDNLRYYPYYGRGYVQLTWDFNYDKGGKLVGEDLVSAPDLALQKQNAIPLLNKGFKVGLYTGKKLEDYVNHRKKDYVGARRCINGTDKAKAIAQLAHEYEYALAVEGIGEGPDLTTAEMPVIGLGDQGAAVMMHQADLYRLGFFSGKQDGVFGRLTESATMEFQKAYDLDPDGKVGRMTRTAMRDAQPRRRALASKSDLRAEGSGTIKDGDRALASGGVAAVVSQGVDVLAGGAVDDVIEKAERLDNLGLLDRITLWIGANMETLILVGGLGLAAYFVIRMTNRRVEDHNTGAHRGR